MASPELKFTMAPRLLVASLERTGSYSGIWETMKELKAWIDSKGIEQSGYPFCLFYDNPTETPERELRSEACIPVAKSFEPEGAIIMKELPEVQVAETRHQGPPEEFAKTYGPFLEGLLNTGYQILGPAREYFMSVSDVKGPGSGFLIHQPIGKKQQA
ncbi:MAG: GyrI-like domain-containing protein [Thaumarchaeota archaeon]|nr:GyrI-like domain-containing protein [Nitrososphaerota archaeon]